MLFNSYVFIFTFLPITLLGFYWIGSVGRHRVAIAWLVAASLFFYGWWNPAYLGLILGSMLFNYAVGVALRTKRDKWVLTGGVAANLALLGYYKYANFFVDNLNAMAGTSFNIGVIILPLGISFFTFQQIAYLVDSYRCETREYRFLHYALFVTFFPQLIAGPIVHHKEMLPQFARDDIYRIRASHMAVGITIFVIGLFKKVGLADGIAVYATPVFQAADSGVHLTFLEAWAGTLAYTLQLYFDFSGYSDMAIGLARMFGVRLPQNFNSPYKATSIIDFWRRWHITLSRFLRDYLYIPLGGNREGEARRLTNLMITMLLGGLWHGAGWTFVLWGGLHGVYLVINHTWHKLRERTRSKGWEASRIGTFFAWLLTFTMVTVAWVPFRAESIQGATSMLASMGMLHGLSLPKSLANHVGAARDWFAAHGILFDGMFQNKVLAGDDACLHWIAALLIIAVIFPNTQQIMRRYRPAFETYRGEAQKPRWLNIEWQPTTTWAVFCVAIFMYSILNLMQVSEFLYFQF